MSKSVRSPETAVEARLSYLYARRAIVDDLIRSLELYHEAATETARKKGPKRQGLPEQSVWPQALAS
ncbi:MAG: hypothetical protein NTY38_12020 [Acidobacteria bacterium]|nr:hypothetical protein [Acidobacteriota bacterium]